MYASTITISAFFLACAMMGQGALAAPSRGRHCKHRHGTTMTATITAEATALANATVVPTSSAIDGGITNSTGLELGVVPSASQTSAAVTSTAITTPAEEASEGGETAVSSTSTSIAAPAATSAASSSGAGSASSSDIKSMVQLHNDFRAQYGAGAVTWSDELASYAASHATVCKMEHTGGPYGENLAGGYGGGYSIADGFNAWADEASEYDASNPQYSHFTQVVWKGTTEIGCAAVNCPGGTLFSSGGESLYIMCEYNPPGNYIGKFAENVGAKSS